MKSPLNYCLFSALIIATTLSATNAWAKPWHYYQHPAQNGGHYWNTPTISYHPQPLSHGQGNVIPRLAEKLERAADHFADEVNSLRSPGGIYLNFHPSGLQFGNHSGTVPTLQRLSFRFRETASDFENAVDRSDFRRDNPSRILARLNSLANDIRYQLRHCSHDIRGVREDWNRVERLLDQINGRYNHFHDANCD